MSVTLSVFCVSPLFLCISLLLSRIIVGAPRGTFPGGLSYEDPGARRVEQTGLVYSCPVLPGTCDGVRGDTTRYLSNTSALDNNGGLGPNMDRPIEFPQNFVEGRLFDQARKL